MSSPYEPPGPVPPAGWYPDARHPGHHRWWDGRQWTDHVQAAQPTPAPEVTAPWAAAPASAGWAPASPTPGYGDTAPTTPLYGYPGTVPPPPADFGAAAQPARNSLAVWAPALGIAGLVTLLIPFLGVVLGTVAVVLGALGVSRARALGGRPAAAVTGLILGAVAVALGLIVTVSVLTLGARAGDPASEPRAVAPTTTAAPLAPPPPVESAPAPGPTQDVPAEAPDGDPDFVRLSRNDLDDVDKDLNDMIVTLDEAGFWRLLSNSVELSFNYAQLAARTPPASIADEWNAQLAVFDEQITRIDDAIADDRTDDLRAIIAETQNQVAVLRGILDRAGG